MEDKDFTSIFRGSVVEADAVHDYLEQQGISSLVRNHMQENLNAGWMTADSEHAAEVFVSRENVEQAREFSSKLFTEESNATASTAEKFNNGPLAITNTTILTQTTIHEDQRPPMRRDRLHPSEFRTNPYVPEDRGDVDNEEIATKPPRHEI